MRERRPGGRGEARAAIVAGMAAAAFGLAAMLFAVQDQAALAGKIKAGGAPVRGAAVAGGRLVVTLEYAGSEDMEPAKVRGHALSVFRAAGGMMPAGAAKVAVEFGRPGKICATWTLPATDAAEYAAGRIDDERLLARVEMTSAVSVKALVESALPDEAGLRKALQRFEAESRTGGATPPPAPALKAQPKVPAKAPATAPAVKPAPAVPPRSEAGSMTTRELIERGGELLKERDYWGATEYFRKTLDAYPMEANQGLGLCYYGAGLIEAALRHFTEAYRLDPRSRLSVLYLATCNDKLGRSDEAIRRYEEYLALQPDDPKVAEFVRGRLQALRGR